MPDDEALRFYFEELTYLRERGAEFARNHHKVASRLELDGAESADPHVERLIESFAFLTGRIQQNLDAEFPRLTTALLGVLYPQLVQPVPPMAIARFGVDPTRLKAATGYTIEKNTPLIARSVDGLPCRFRTSYDVDLWPVEVSDATVELARDLDIDEPQATVTHVLRVALKGSSGGLKLKDLDFRRPRAGGGESRSWRLRFFLNGPPDLTSRIYDLLCTSKTAVWLRVPPSDDRPEPQSIRLGPNSIRQVGFRTRDEVIPCPTHSHPGYRLIQEYFHFPDKFRFFDIRGLERVQDLNLDEGHFEILLPLTEDPGRLRLRKDTFQLGCTPIVNLFPKTTEPVRVDHRQLEYRLVGDQRRELTTEIHSILSVSASSNSEEKKATQYDPFYSFRHPWAAGPPGKGPEQAFWIETRRPRADQRGTDVYLSFLNPDFEPAQPSDEVVFAHTLCTNRELALELRENARLEIETPAPIHEVICLVKPTPPARPLMGGKTAWQLISNLSLNHLSLASKDGLDALREMLRVYSLHESPSVRHQIEGISNMEMRRVLRRSSRHPAGGFRTGNLVTLEFETGKYSGGSAVLFASVLRHFLALHTSINSFMQVVARRTNDERTHIWKRWPALAGEQPLV